VGILAGCLGAAPLTALCSTGSEALMAMQSPVAPLGLGLLAAGAVATVASSIRSARQTEESTSSLGTTDRLSGRMVAEPLESIPHTEPSPSRESMELLAAGLLHDLNNQLSAVRMSSQLIARMADGVPEIQKRTDGIERSIQQARQLIASMAGLYAGSETRGTSAEVVQVISDTVQAVQESHLASTRVEVITPSAPLLAKVQSTSLHRILLNLIINAGEAMEGRGCLRIQVERIRSLEKTSLVLAPAHATSWIRISVSDSGSGIAPEALHRLFQPSYSTKNRQNRIGSGLGLYVVHTLSKDEGIGLGVQSKVGEGTRFDLILPSISASI
jgi:signal transduction histidine kinase